jgi:hypothetical protein
MASEIKMMAGLNRTFDLIYRIFQLRDWCQPYSVQTLFSASTIWSAATGRRFRFHPTHSDDKSPYSRSILS